MTGAHEASVHAVAAGAADVAAIDCVTWAHLQRLRPASVTGLRVLDWTASSPGLPLITSLRTTAVTCDRLSRAFEEVATDGTLAPVLRALLIDGFQTVPLRAYDAVRELERLAAKLGYPMLR
jgi:ABC-type phosphate/phosphonate transport system substrate-binding protein